MNNFEEKNPFLWLNFLKYFCEKNVKSTKKTLLSLSKKKNSKLKKKVKNREINSMFFEVNT